MDFFLSSLWWASIVLLGIVVVGFIAIKALDWVLPDDKHWRDFDS